MIYRYILIFSLICSFNSAFSLDLLTYKRFRFDLNLLLNFSWFKNSSLNFNLDSKNPRIGSLAFLGLSVEPKYSITKHWSIGLLASTKTRVNPLNNMQVKGKDNSSGKVELSLLDLMFMYEFTNDFHFFPNKIARPYIGIGIGVLINKPTYIPTMGDFSKYFAIRNDKNQQIPGIIENESFQKQAYFIMSPRVGIDVGHIRFNIVYNLAFINNYQKLDFKGKAFVENSNTTNNESKIIEFTGVRPKYNNLTGQIIFYLGGGEHSQKRRKNYERNKLYEQQAQQQAQQQTQQQAQQKK